MAYVRLAIVSYMLGSVPFSYLASKLFKSIDVRRIGSRNVGATNVLLHVGVVPAIFAAAGDVSKGVLAVLIARAGAADYTAAQLLALFFAVMGHNWPIWLRFEGGGGLATTIGGFLLISVWAMLALLGVWAGSYLLTRHKYFSSVFTCTVMPFLLGIWQGSWEYFAFGLGTGSLLGVKQVLAWVRFARNAAPRYSS